MREQIEKKLEEVISNILEKDAKDITYNEYRILDSKLQGIKYEEETKKRNAEYAKRMSELMTSCMGCSAPMPEVLPDSEDN